MHGQRLLPRERPHDEPERREAPAPAPEIARLLALQRSAGNATVARAVLARKKFKDQDAALEWLDGKPAQQEGQTEDAWLNALLDADTTGYELQKDRTQNLRILKAARVKAAKGAKQQSKSVREAKPKGPKRTVSADVMTHIVDGVLNDEGKPTGFHSVQGTNPVAEKTGNPVPKADDCYWSNVQSIKGKKAKPKGSTFYPDDWTPQDIQTAIETAEETVKNREYLTTADAKKADLPLFFNGESYYPNYR